MASQSNLKAVLFDVGGVLASSPMQAIHDFEQKHGIQRGWINFAIRQSSPNGAWQRLERSEISLDDAFFANFGRDLGDGQAWQAFQADNAPSMRQERGTRPTGLEDGGRLQPATNAPQHESLGNGSKRSDNEKPSLSKLAKDTTIGDPVSLEAEDVLTAGGGQHARSTDTRAAHAHRQKSTESKIDGSRPPKVDSEELFWKIVSASRELDPYFLPAVQELLSQRSRPLLGVVSNNFKLPPSQGRSRDQDRQFVANGASHDLVSMFDVFIASSDVGMRKPSEEIYQLAVDRLNEVDKRTGGAGAIKSHEIVFLDDIGENLKTARAMGMRTIQVRLGKSWRAVKELESMLGMSLMDERTRKAKL